MRKQPSCSTIVVAIAPTGTSVIVEINIPIAMSPRAETVMAAPTFTGNGTSAFATIGAITAPDAIRSGTATTGIHGYRHPPQPGSCHENYLEITRQLTRYGARNWAQTTGTDTVMNSLRTTADSLSHYCELCRSGFSDSRGRGAAPEGASTLGECRFDAARA